MTSVDAAVIVIDALGELKIPYILVGALASNFYGLPRATQDVDVLIQVESDTISKLSQKLSPIITIDRQLKFETITMSVMNEAVVTGTALKIEFFHLSDDEFQQERFRRRIQVSEYGRTVFLPTVEDVVVMKSRWRRPKDIIDIEMIVGLKDSVIDWPYVYSWAEKHGTRQLLDEIRSTVPKI